MFPDGFRDEDLLRETDVTGEEVSHLASCYLEGGPCATFLGLGVNPLLFVFAAALVWLILGTFLEAIPNIYLTVPIAFPIAMALQIDLLQLYVICCVFVGIGLITPPVCVGAYTSAAVANEPPERVIRHLFPVYTIVLVACGIVYMLIPQFSTWIPGMMK